MSGVDGEPGGNPYRRLPPRVRPTGSEQDVSPPPPLPEVKETVSFTPAGQVRAYEQLAEAATSAPRRSWPRAVVLAILGLNVLILLGLWLSQR